MAPGLPAQQEGVGMDFFVFLGTVSNLICRLVCLRILDRLLQASQPGPLLAVG